MSRELYNKRFYSNLARQAQSSAEVVVPLVMDLLHPKSVLDVGCGLGQWLNAFQKYGVDEISGIEGRWVRAEDLAIPDTCFLSANLEHPFKINRTFDLAMSLEVAEHLPKSRAASFVADLVHHAPIVLFSAAIPGQGGTNHINCQWPSWWAYYFDQLGFKPYDIIRPLIWGNKDVAWWYQQNILIFAREGHLSSIPVLNPDLLNLKHPELG